MGAPITKGESVEINVTKLILSSEKRVTFEEQHPTSRLPQREANTFSASMSPSVYYIPLDQERELSLNKPKK